VISEGEGLDMLAGANDQEKLKSLAKKTHKEQAIWFLNAFWHTFAEKEGNNVWTFKHKFDELDLVKHAEGNELDELNFHRFLEALHSTMTSKQCRDFLSGAGVDMTRIAKYISICHFLVAKYKADWHKLVNASQGDNQAEIDRAQALLDQVQEAFNHAEKSAAEAAKRETELRAAEEEVARALAELQAQENAFNQKKEELERKSREGSTVQKSKAANELAQHLASDPLPLRRAKTTTEAAKRKAEKAVKAAEEARVQAEKDVEAARAKVAEAEAYLEEVKAKAGSAQGILWWMSRELEEKKKYMPQRKGGVTK